MKKIKITERFWRYLKSHLWVQVGSVFAASLLLITFCYLYYMKGEYSNYLYEKNLLMETNVLDIMQKNMDYALKDYIKLGSKIAIDEDVYKLADELLVQEENLASNALKLKYSFSAMGSLAGNVLNLSLVSEDGSFYQYDRMLRGKTSMWSMEDRTFLKTMYSQVYETAIANHVPRYMVSAYPSTHPTTGERVFHIFYPMVGKESSFDKMNAMLCVTYKMDILEPLIDGFSEAHSSYVVGYITDKFDNIIYHSAQEFIGESESTYLATGDIVTVGETVEPLGWTLHLSINKTRMDENVTPIVYRGMGVYILLLVGLSGIFLLIIRTINYPLKKIKSAMIITGSGEKQKHVTVKGQHEIWQVAEGYNDMLDKLIQRELEAEKSHRLSLLALERQHAAENEALESQINAHFLCNTLGTINYEAMESGNYKISVMIKKLSNILRYSFDQKCQQVYMFQEIAWTAQYLYLQKARFEDVFDYIVSFPDEYGQWPCCKLMLQPFVENAILHGFEGWESGGMLEITARKKEELLELKIQDNGCGISPEKLERIRKVLKNERTKSIDDIGIGIQNVASRMRLFYGSEVQILVDSQVGQGTTFTFYLPFPPKENVQTDFLDSKEDTEYEVDDSRG
ncbi:MAG: histidine kinase [Lachnospiraceae bacterium]|nr:histidine kinase [Lachnospiraceae bacterium]